MFLHPLRGKFITLHEFAKEGPFPYRLDDLGAWGSTKNMESGHFHGVEFAVAYGTPVHSVSNGMIISASYEDRTDHSQGMGLRVRQLISFAGHDSWTMLYGFLSEVMVHPGQQVLAGERIAYSGDSGASGGSKLRMVMMNLRGEFREPKFRASE